jgi:hypothetical protein
MLKVFRMLAGNVLDEGTVFSPTNLENDSDIESYFTGLYQSLINRRGCALHRKLT